MVTSLLSAAEGFGAKLRRSVESLDRDDAGKAYETRSAYYSMLERYYSGEMYERADAGVSAIKAWAGLPRNIRPIALVAKRAVDWWPGSVYPGSWTADGLPASNGRPSKIPYDTDTPPELRLAVQQAFAWGNGPRLLSRLVHLGAKLGNVLAEVEVHWSETGPQGHKIYPVLIHPKYVVELEINKRGDVKLYRLRIPQWDPVKRRQYWWGKRVTRDTITTYYDDEEHGYDGQPATIPNPYPFVPASWIVHQAQGADHGAPAIDGIIPTLDEYQGLLSTIDDYLHKFVRQPVVIGSNNPDKLQQMLTGQGKGGPTHERGNANADREILNVLPAPAETTMHHMLQNLGLGDAHPQIDRISSEIERTLPWVTLDEQLLEMDNVTAPGALPLVRRVEQLLNDVAGNYDSLGVVKLGQMCAAIGGHHANNGDWGLRSQLTNQQQAFLPFGLESYERNELDFSLTSRELVPQTMTQKLQEATILEGLTTPTGLRHVGFGDDEIYGVDENGTPLAPEPRPGMLSESPAGNAAAVGDALVRTFNAGLVGV